MSQDIMAEWRHVHGVKLGYVDGGWMVGLSALPNDTQKVTTSLQSRAMGKAMAEHVATEVARGFSQALHDLSAEDMIYPSVQKNNMFEVSNFRICSEDQDFILSLLAKSIKTLVLPLGLTDQRPKTFFITLLV